MGTRTRNISRISITTATPNMSSLSQAVNLDKRRTFGYSWQREFVSETLLEHFKNNGTLPRGAKEIVLTAILDEKEPTEVDLTGHLSGYYEFRGKNGSTITVKNAPLLDGKFDFTYHAKSGKRLGVNSGDGLSIEEGHSFDEMGDQYGLDAYQRLVDLNSPAAIYVESPEDYANIGRATTANTYLKMEMGGFNLDESEWELGYWEYYGDDYETAREEEQQRLDDIAAEWRSGFDEVPAGPWNFTREQVEAMIDSVNSFRGPRNKLYTAKSGITAGQYLDSISDAEVIPLVKDFFSRYAKLSFYGTAKILERK